MKSSVAKALEYKAIEEQSVKITAILDAIKKLSGRIDELAKKIDALDGKKPAK